MCGLRGRSLGSLVGCCIFGRLRDIDSRQERRLVDKSEYQLIEGHIVAEL